MGEGIRKECEELVYRVGQLPEMSVGQERPRPGSQRSLILSELEDELERQLEEKASRNELSVLNVKSLLRAVLTHDDVRKYVEFTLNKSEEKPDYKLQLTRAKAKELIDKIPTIAPLLCLPTPQKKSDIDVLINAELSEDSSDEEYQPVDETLDDEEDSLHEPTKECDDPPIAFIVSPSLPEEFLSLSEQDAENIGQRTRSKLSLSETPLETIEQAFIPPDITTDMYNTNCDNQDWLNFLKELVQPLDTSNDGVETNDDENDPEYNVMIDEELEASDNEELRVDRAVKISKKELNNLMSELFEYMRMHEDGLYSDEDNNTQDENNIESLITERVDDSTAGMIIEKEEQLQIIPITNKTDPVTIESVEYHDSSFNLLQLAKTGAIPILPSIKPNPEEQPLTIDDVSKLFKSEQFVLIKQQMTQHYQLLLQSYLLCCGNPFVEDENRKICRDKMNNIKELADSSPYPDSLFAIPTIGCSLELMAKYDRYVLLNEDALIRWNHSISEREIYKKTRMKGGNCIHPHLMKICLRSYAFQYPLLLPRNGFMKNNARQRTLFAFSEDILIAMGLEDCETELGLNVDNHQDLVAACDVILRALLPGKGSIPLMNHIVNMKKANHSNVIQEYFCTRCAPSIEHFVVPVSGELKPLYKQNPRLMHNNWLKVFYEVQDSRKVLLTNRKRIKIEENRNA